MQQKTMLTRSNRKGAQTGFKELASLQYLGNKSRLLNHICQPIINNSEISTVVDLFAGTGSVGYALKDYLAVRSNDVEYFAYVLNQGILNGCTISEDEFASFWQAVNDYLNQIQNHVQDALVRENLLFSKETDFFPEKTSTLFYFLKEFLGVFFDIPLILRI